MRYAVKNRLADNALGGSAKAAQYINFTFQVNRIRADLACRQRNPASRCRVAYHSIVI
jgi:hypothetical protein